MSPPPAIPPQAASAEQAHWFREEVHPHDASLKAYLRSSFPEMRNVDDMVQESYLRIWKTRMARPITSTKAFLFQIARHLAIDTLRRNRAVVIESHGDLSELFVIDHKPDAAETLSYNEKADLLAEALAALPKRCREVVILRRLRCLSQKEVASQLGISERTVESQLARGLNLCLAFLRKRGLHGLSRDEP